jgi:GTP1/Obg family GTP-binding protein
MNTSEALQTIRVATVGMSDLVTTNVASLDELTQHHRDMAGVLAARREFRAVLPSIQRLRSACERFIRELETWPE